MIAAQSKRKKFSSVLATATAALLVVSGVAIAPTAAFADEGSDVPTASLSWGIKASFLNYIGGNNAKGSMTLLGTTGGAFDWLNGEGSAASDGTSGTASFGEGNGVQFDGHAGALDVRFTNPRVDIESADSATLYFDAKVAEYGDNPAVDAAGVPFADIALGEPVVADGLITWTAAPAILTAEGATAFASFYEEGAALDPVTVSIPVAGEEGDVDPVWAPEIKVFKADGVTPVANADVREGDEVVVKGTGFDPAANVGGRGVPIPNDLPQGTYVVFGNFAEDWKPSIDVASSARKVGSQGWVLTDETVAGIPANLLPAITPQRVVLAEGGSFTWTATLSDPNALEDGNFGIYTYAAGGVKNASQELYVPLNYKYSSETTITASKTSINEGDAVSFEAQVEAAQGEANGTVGFFDGSKQVGSSQTVVGGKASLTTSELAAGTRNITAEFTPASLSQVAKSTSLAISISVKAEAKPTPTPTPTPKVTFTDIKKGDKFFKEISWMATEGISTGVKQSNGTYKFEPKSNVTREAMAAFLFRNDKSSASFKAPTTSPFTDVKPGDKFYKEITWMAAKGISTGVKQSNGSVKFMPKSSITREAMAAFMYRIDKKAKPALPQTSPFVDVKKGDKFYKEIVWMGQKGISTGNKQPSGKPTYAPKSSVTREAMSAFLYRAK